ncbi:hypothetical protein PIB30_066097 [Stylosanthes scabra]|uniref:Putative plant transposon protein domain-containing protein n=1 Tax=Stylosanthes scabra TaxID=79078 RepID=A0ABU6QMN7_9FABA|nr:hypothetical protein [Stylosanthes scabra]
MGRVRGPREPRQNPLLEQEIEEEAPQQQHQNYQQQQNFPLDFMANFNNTMAAMQQHYDQRWDAFQQKFDDAQGENRRNFGTINERMNQMDEQLSFLCYSHQMANESMLFPYQNTKRQMREMEQQDIPVTMANPNIHRNREEEIRQEKMRFEKVLEEAAAQKAKEQNKGKARGVKEEYDDEEGGEWLNEVLRDLCILGATWKLSSSQPAVPIQLKRIELHLLAKGWQEFIIHSLVPTGNKSEVTTTRAILIHSIMQGEDVRADEIIVDNIATIAQGLKNKGNLAHPSTIYKLCKDADVPLREFRRTPRIPELSYITAK